MIIAWLNGERIQRQDDNGDWQDGFCLFDDQSLPSFFTNRKYRIKPANIVVRKYIEYHFYNGDNCWTPDTKKPNFEFEFNC